MASARSGSRARPSEKTTTAWGGAWPNRPASPSSEPVEERVGVGRRRGRLRHAAGSAASTRRPGLAEAATGAGGRRTAVDGGEAAAEPEDVRPGPSLASGASASRIVRDDLVPPGRPLAQRHALRGVDEVDHLRPLDGPRGPVDPDGVEQDHGEQDARITSRSASSAGRAPARSAGPRPAAAARSATSAARARPSEQAERNRGVAHWMVVLTFMWFPTPAESTS